MQRKRKKVSHFLLEEQLNKGSFGTVYRGLDLNNSEPRAIKVIGKVQATSRQKQSLEREIQIMLSLKHDNIVKLYDHLETANNTYLILELCNNGDLSKFSSGISELQTLIYIRQLISALKVLHEHSIVHRDLKPANIFLASENKIKLGDFGLARTVNALNLAETYAGTPFYMAPEVLQLRSTSEKYDFKADIWSLGCIVYELITGQRPFSSKEGDELLPDILQTISSESFLSDSKFSIVCKDFLTRIFQIDPENRISFEKMCQHQFVLGMPSLPTIINLNGIQSLSENLTVITAEDALDLAQAVKYSAEYCSHPFLLYMKACMSLKAYSENEKCRKELKIVFGKAQQYINSTKWEKSSTSRVLLETVILMCGSDESLPLYKLRENFKNAYILLKSLKHSTHLDDLKTALKNQFCV